MHNVEKLQNMAIYQQYAWKRSKTETNMNMKLTSQINKQINDHGAYFLDNYITLKAFTKKTLGKI